MEEQNENNEPEQETPQGVEELSRSESDNSILSHFEPPIGGGGGSFFFDIPHEHIELREGNFDGNYFPYDFNCLAVSSYTAIDRVEVLTELADGEVSFKEHPTKEDQNLKLRLWLSEDKDSPEERDADIIIDGNNGGSILTKHKLELVSELSKNNRNSRYYYPYRKMSVVKWDLFHDLVGALESHESDDMYYFYIHFRYIH